MMEITPGYEGYVGVGLVPIMLLSAWKNGHENGVVKGCDATLTLLHMNKAISIVEDSKWRTTHSRCQMVIRLTLDVKTERS